MRNNRIMLIFKVNDFVRRLQIRELIEGVAKVAAATNLGALQKKNKLFSGEKLSTKFLSWFA